MDGGDIIFYDFKNGIVYLEMYKGVLGNRLSQCPNSYSLKWVLKIC